MIFNFFIILTASFLTVSCQTISCIFEVDTQYRCDATVNNPQGLDGDFQITGTHVDGRSDDDVREIRIVAGSTTLIPSALCRQFPLTEFYRAIVNVGISRLTENTFRNCSQLLDFEIRENHITEVHPQLFFNNVQITRILFQNLQMITLPEQLFSTLTSLRAISIRISPTLIDLPANIFENNHQLQSLTLNRNMLNYWRPEWTRHKSQLTSVLTANQNFSTLPRNVLNSENLVSIWVDNNRIEEIDFFMFNDMPLLTSLSFWGNRIKAIDFNLIDRATSLERLDLMEGECLSVNLIQFPQFREAHMVRLEPCFEAFDNRIMSFTTLSSAPIFNSIRRERIQLQVQTFSDAILTISANPDGSSPNFEIFLGIDGNTRSCIHENGVRLSCTATPGYLNPDRMVPFSITMSNNWVFVQQETATVILQQLQAPFTARFMGVRTSGHTACWIIQQQ